MVGAALSSCWGLAAVWRENRKWQLTSIAGRGHGTDGVCGDEVTFAEAGEPLLHESNESVDGILLLASAQRHALRTQMHTNQMLGLTLFQSATCTGTQPDWPGSITACLDPAPPRPWLFGPCRRWLRYTCPRRPAVRDKKCCKINGTCYSITQCNNVFTHKTSIKTVYLMCKPLIRPPSAPSFPFPNFSTCLHQHFRSPSGWWMVPPSLPTPSHPLTTTLLWSAFLP